MRILTTLAILAALAVPANADEMGDAALKLGQCSAYSVVKINSDKALKKTFSKADFSGKGVLVFGSCGKELSTLNELVGSETTAKMMLATIAFFAKSSELEILAMATQYKPD